MLSSSPCRFHGRMFPRTASAVAAGLIATVCSAVPPAAGAVVSYSAVLSGPAESPTNNSPGTGTGLVDIDTAAHTLRVRAAFSGLLGTTTASHVHAATATPGAGTAPVATQTPTFTNFPLGVTSGTYDMTFDTTQMATWNASYITSTGGTTATAEAAFAQSLAAGTAYLNIHSSSFGGGEIRGFLTPVPAPGATGLVGVGVVAVVRRRRW